MEKYFGVKVHVIVDTNYGIPLAIIVTTANKNDSVMLRPLVKKSLDAYEWLKPKYLMADKDYDSQANHRYLRKQGITSVIAIRQPTSADGLYDGLYGCRLKNSGTKSITHCDSVEWLDPEDNPCVLGGLPRNSQEWKRRYRKRWAVERLFSILKQSRLLGSCRYRGDAKISLHCTLSFLTHQVT